MIEYVKKPTKPVEQMTHEELKTLLWTCPPDPRFPNQNQTKHCYQNYLDFHRCSKKHGEDYDACQWFKKCYESLCPMTWVDKWDTQIEEGRFPGRI